MMQCKLKKKCPVPADPLYNCWNAECEGWCHISCSKLLLDKHEIPGTERPPTLPPLPGEEPIVFCTKTCYTKWRSSQKKQARQAVAAAKEAAKKKRKVPWEDDGSLLVLMDWITTQGNCAAYCGSNGNKGKRKTQYHKEIALLIQKKHPDSERNEKDVENKIGSLERQFRLASDWANNTGQGVDDPGSFEEAVKKRCPLYYELEDIMGDRPNAKALASNEDSSGCGDSHSSGVVGQELARIEGNKNETNPPSDLPVEVNAEARETPKDNPPPVHSGKDNTPAEKQKGKKRLSSNTDLARKRGKGKGDTDADSVITSYFNDNSFKELREREVAAREREANARMLEAQATSEKAKKETQILSIDERVKLLRERKALLDEGVCTEEDLDKILPLPY